MFKAVFITILVLSVTAEAGPQSLTLRKKRPTTEQILEANGGNEQLPFGGGSWFDEATYSEPLAAAIAQFELIMPHGVYVGLGRDAAMLGDMIDAFYISHGERGRVMRLNASTPTLETSKAKIVRFLKHAGLPLDNIEKAERGYLIFDFTSYKVSSQSTKIMKAAYDYLLHHNNATPNALVRKFNGTSINAATYGYSNLFAVTASKIDDFFKSQADNIKDYGYPLLLPVTTGEASKISYTTEWHGSFGRLRTSLITGRYEARIPMLYSRHKRRHIMNDVVAASQWIQKPEFLELVKAKARELEFEFSFSEPRTCKAVLERTAS